MAGPCVALVSRDPRARLELAAAFDAAPVEWRLELHETPPPGVDAVVLGADVARGPAGAIAFDPADPGRALDAVRQRLRRGAPGVVAVTSATGGAGATSVALHLAAAARSPACLVDLAGGAAYRLGLAPPGRPGPEATGEPVPVPGGFRLLVPGPEGGSDAASARLEDASASFSFVLVDVAPGPLLDPVLARCRAAVLVVTPALPAARRSRALLDSAPPVAWAVVTNRLGPGGETTRPELEAVLGRRIALELPCCPALRDAEDAGRLLLSRWTRWRRAVDRLAAAVAQRA